MKQISLKTTPITEETFKRQKWYRHYVDSDNQFIKIDDDIEPDKPYFFLLPLPKTRLDKYAAFLVTNASDDTEALLSLDLPPDHFFVEIMGTDGLGFCTSEEELEVLYRALTGAEIED